MQLNIPEIFNKLAFPHFYSGAEINVIKKGFSSDFLNICLAFADTYEVGMSSSGLRINYHLLNSFEGINAERVFMPHRENLELFQKRDLFSLESRKSISEFDLLAFSLMSELNYTNLLWMLKLGRIPVLTADRDSAHPLIMAGGMATLNPEPLVPFIDFFALGEAEAIWPQILPLLLEFKRGKIQRADLLEKLQKFDGIYCGKLVKRKKTGRFVVPEVSAIKKKQVMQSFSADNSLWSEIVPLGKTVFNRLSIELMRGCVQSCRFCQARSYYAPVRVNPSQQTIQQMQFALEATGHTDISLGALSCGDYPFLSDLLRQIKKCFSSGTSFSFPSLRPVTLNSEMLQLLVDFRKTGITLAIEAGSERLRSLLNKNFATEEIFQALKLMTEHGWKKLKIYFMLGIPAEEVSDIEQSVALINEIKRVLKTMRIAYDIHLSFSPFVPKPHTPLQWAEFGPLSKIEEHVKILKRELLKDRRVKADFHSPLRAMVETILARGDIEVANLLLAVFNQGECFTGWENYFQGEIWKAALQNFSFQHYLEKIPVEQPLPWDFIQTNYKKNYLLAEYEKSLSFEKTPSCLQRDCTSCKGCFQPVKKTLFEKSALAETELILKTVTDSDEEIPVWIFYKKKNLLRYFSHLVMIEYLERILRRSGIALSYTAGFHAHLKMSCLDPLPVGAESEMEVVEVFLKEKLLEICCSD